MVQQHNTPFLRFPEFSREWTIKKIKDIAPLQRGFDLTTTSVVVGKYPVVYSNGILRSHIEYKVKGPGVVTGRSGTIGKVSYVEDDYWPHNTSLWVTSFHDNDPKYIYYMYNEINLAKYNAGSTVPTLNRNDVHVIKKYIPKIEEQQKIASFLSAVDEKIIYLQKKKDLLENYKKGCMQKLFSQELRFTDDDGNAFPDWDADTIHGVFTSSKGYGLSKEVISEEGKYPCVLYGELYTKYPERIEKVQSASNEDDGKESQKGDLLVPASTTTSGIDLANITLLPYEGVRIGGDVTILRAKKLICELFYAYYLTHYKKYELAKYAQGITIVHLYFNHFKKIKIDCPHLKEQKKIADFLSALEDKITLVAQELNKAKAFKKGLLQQMFV